MASAITAMSSMNVVVTNARYIQRLMVTVRFGLRLRAWFIGYLFSYYSVADYSTVVETDCFSAVLESTTVASDCSVTTSPVTNLVRTIHDPRVAVVLVSRLVSDFPFRHWLSPAWMRLC